MSGFKINIPYASDSQIIGILIWYLKRALNIDKHSWISQTPNVKEEVSAYNNIPEIYFESADHWRQWLEEYHDKKPGINLIFYKVGHEKASMRWEDAVKVALCFGWIDSTVKSLGDGKRRQYFCPRKPKSTWSKLNKKYIKELTGQGLMHSSGMQKIKDAKKDKSWFALDKVENGVIPEDLQKAFDRDPQAFENYKQFSYTYKKSYLYWLQQAKRPETRAKRIAEIVDLCAANIKSRS